MTCSSLTLLMEQYSSADSVEVLSVINSLRECYETHKSFAISDDELTDRFAMFKNASSELFRFFTEEAKTVDVR